MRPVAAPARLLRLCGGRRESARQRTWIATLRFATLGLIAGAALAGCAVGPDFQPPAPPMPANYAGASAANATRPNDPGDARAADPARWWRALNDRELDALIDRAIAASPTLEIALNRLQQARAQEAVVVGAALPALEAQRGRGVRHRKRFGPRPRRANAGVRREWRRRVERDQPGRLRCRLADRPVRQIPARDRGGAVRRRGCGSRAQHGAGRAGCRCDPRLPRPARIANAACGAAQGHRGRAEVRRFRSGALQPRYHQ